MEQGAHHRPETTFAAETRLVDPGPPGDGGQPMRPGVVQHGRRQQASGMRLGLPEGPGRFCRRKGEGARLGHPGKTGKPARFEIPETTRQSLERRIADPEMLGLEYLWPSHLLHSAHLSTRQYARILRDWVLSIGLEPRAYGTHSMRRTKVAQFYKKTGNLRAVKLLLGYTKMDSTVRRYLGVDVDDALTLSERMDL